MSHQGQIAPFSLQLTQLSRARQTFGLHDPHWLMNLLMNMHYFYTARESVCSRSDQTGGVRGERLDGGSGGRRCIMGLRSAPYNKEMGIILWVQFYQLPKLHTPQI